MSEILPLGQSEVYGLNVFNDPLNGKHRCEEEPVLIQLVLEL